MIVKSVGELLAEAEAALHNLRIGRQSIEVEVDGRKVRYARTDVESLQGYVDGLRMKVSGCGPRYGAIGVRFN